MSRFNPNRNVGPVLAAAQQWIQHCLMEQQSLFSDRALWTPATLEEVRVAFTDNPDAGDASFFNKLEGQMHDASADAKCLMAELLWVLMLFQSNIGPAKKRDSIQRVWSWSGIPLDMNNPLLADAALIGVGSPGTAYNTQRWRELNYLIGLAIDLARRSREERAGLLGDRDRFEQWILTAPQEGYRQFRHLFRYLAFPDQNERITLNRDRRLILEAFTGMDKGAIRDVSDAAQDDALHVLRGRLKAEHGKAELDFYEPEFAALWRENKDVPAPGATRADAFPLGYAELRERFLAQFPKFDSFSGASGYEKERSYKDELVGLFAQGALRALSAEDWAAAGDAAVAILKQPLQHNDGKPQNIVGWRYVDALRHLEPARRIKFAQALAALLDEDEPIGHRIDSFVEGLTSLVGEETRVQPGAQRSIVSFYLALADPRRHLFLKTDEMGRALRKLDPSFSWNPNRLTGADVIAAEALAFRVFEQLESEGWAPRDLLDVQGFLWVATAYGTSHIAENDEDGAEAMPKQGSNHTQPLNQILFGPPGTGKTFETVTKALEIIDPEFIRAHRGERSALKARFDQLVQESRIRFVTFHQSFSYEDFVEGLRADNDDDGNLRYRVEPGVFKDICTSARGSAKASFATGVEEGARIWKISIDGTHPSPTRDYCFAHDEARIGWGEVGDLRNPNLHEHQKYLEWGSNDRNTMRTFANEVQAGDVLVCIKSASEVAAIGVVQGDYRFEAVVPNGVKPTYNNVRPVKWLRTGLAVDLRKLNGGHVFTAKTLYELTRFDWPELTEAMSAAGVDMTGSDDSSIQPQLEHVLIIDEINRGNVSRIFGELITLIEPSKRAGAEEQLEVLLPYSKKPFTVPSSVHLIGTMNTSDRSLAGLDIALRRRFEFVEMPARPDLLRGVDVDGIDMEAMLGIMNQRIEALLDRDHHLGHAYFMPLVSDPSLSRLAAIFRTQILPLLQEYFFEDWERIRWVLNDQNKPDEHCFVVMPKRSVADLFAGAAEVPSDARLWQLNREALTRRESYLGILGR